jgi:hypothetical protein
MGMHQCSIVGASVVTAVLVSFICLTAPTAPLRWSIADVCMACHNSEVARACAANLCWYDESGPIEMGASTLECTLHILASPCQLDWLRQGGT